MCKTWAFCTDALHSLALLKPSLQSTSLLLHSLLGRDAVGVDLALALVHGNLVFRRTGYLLLQLL